MEEEMDDKQDFQQQEENNEIYLKDNFNSVKQVGSFNYEITNLVWSKCVYFTESEFAAGLDNGDVIIINTKTMKTKRLELLNDGCKTEIKDIAFLNNNSIMITCYFHTKMRVWDLKDNHKFIKRLPIYSRHCVIIQDRYVSTLDNDIAQISILDSKKDYAIVKKISLLDDNFNTISYITNFQPCSYLLSFIDRKYLFTYNLKTNRFITRFKLKGYGEPIRVKSYKQDHFYLVLVLFSSQSVAIFDVVLNKVIYYKKFEKFVLNGSSIQLCDFIDSSHFIVGSDFKEAYIVNFHTKNLITIQSNKGFVGSFTYKNMIFTTSDKDNSINVWEIK